MPAIVWKGYISFGLVSFPVRLFAAARPESVHFHMLHKKDLSRVKEVWYCAEEDKPGPHQDRPWEQCGDYAFMPVCMGGCLGGQYLKTGRLDQVHCRKPEFELMFSDKVKRRYESELANHAWEYAP